MVLVADAARAIQNNKDLYLVLNAKNFWWGYNFLPMNKFGALCRMFSWI